ncbi:MAG: beta-lactamase family protein [bacterium]|nr:beta-lactamase family protein [bacterium]
MKRITLILLCLVFLFTAGQFPRDTAGFETFKKELQTKLNKLAQAEGFPGVTLGIVLPGGKEVSLASGLADIELKKKMKPTDRILMGSIGKTYAASVALQLLAEKKFSLDDRIKKYLGGEKWFKRLPNAEDITIRMLMNHSAGLPRYAYKPELWRALLEAPEKVWKPEELVAFILDEKPLYPAGKGWSYTDQDYIVLGMIIEKVTGKTYYDELKRRVLEPHGLKDTSPAVSRRLRGLVPGYTADRKPPFGLPAKMMADGVYVLNPQFEWTGGGLVTTSLDLARFIKLLLEGKIVSKEYLEQMKQPVSEESGKRDSVGYGLGLEVWKTAHGIAYGHRGTMPGYGSITEYIPAYGFSIAIQINTDRESGRLDKKKTRNDYIDVLKPLIVNYIKSTE